MESTPAMSKPVLVECFVSPPLDTNAYLVVDEAKGVACAVDPSCIGQKMLDRCAGQGWKIETLVLTHGHIDHTHDMALIARETGAEVLAHGQTAPLMRDAMLSGAQWLNMQLEPLKPTREITDGDSVMVGDYAFQVLHTPGHSPGCICLLGEKACLTGDLLFRGGVGRYDLPGGDEDTLVASLRKLLEAGDPHTVIYPGHGPSSTLGEEQQGNLYLRQLLK